MNLTSTLDAALFYISLGIRVIRLNGKVPMDASWPNIASNDTGQIHSWFADGKANIGLPTGAINGTVVVDFDNMSAPREFYKKNIKHISIMVKTRRGVHFYFGHPGFPVRNSSDRNNHCDVRGDFGQVVVPPSVVNGHEYRWIEGNLQNFGKLPLFDPSWIAEPSDKTTTTGKGITDGLAYICQNFAISGKGGHNNTFRAACKLRDSGMSESEALAALIEWNRTNAKPPWDLQSLVHKVTDAYRVKS